MAESGGDWQGNVVGKCSRSTGQRGKFRILWACRPPMLGVPGGNCFAALRVWTGSRLYSRPGSLSFGPTPACMPSDPSLDQGQPLGWGTLQRGLWKAWGNLGVVSRILVVALTTPTQCHHPTRVHSLYVTCVREPHLIFRVPDC